MAQQCIPQCRACHKQDSPAFLASPVCNTRGHISMLQLRGSTLKMPCPQNARPVSGAAACAPEIDSKTHNKHKVYDFLFSPTQSLVSTSQVAGSAQLARPGQRHGSLASRKAGYGTHPHLQRVQVAALRGVLDVAGAALRRQARHKQEGVGGGKLKQRSSG